MATYNAVLKLLNQKSTTTIFSVVDYLKNKKHDVDVSNVILFFKNYCETLYQKDMSGWNKPPVLALGEKTGDAIPVISEFTFRFEDDATDTDSDNDEDIELYERDLVNIIVKIHHDTMKELFFLSSERSEFICVVSESKIWKDYGNLCCKIKFQFPYCRTTKKFINTTFRTKIIQKLRQSRVNNLFPDSSPIGDWDTHFEKVKDYYPIYGSVEDPKTPPTLLTSVLGDHDIEIPLEKVYDFKNHHYISSEKCITGQIELLEDEDLNSNEKSLYLLPLFLSLDFWGGVMQIKEEYNSGGITNNSSSSYILSDDDEYESDDSNPSDIEIFSSLIEMLNKTRFFKEAYFLDIGKALYNIFEGDEEGVEEWIKISEEKKSPFKEDFCRLKYDDFDSSPITIKTIAWYAKQDSKMKYMDWHEKWCRGKLIQALNMKHVIVAEAFYRVFWLDYMYTGKKWVEFRKNKLHILSEDFSIRKNITNKFIPCFDKLRSCLSDEKLKLNKTLGKTSNNREKLNDLERLISETGKLIDKLLSETFRGPLVKSFKEYFFVENLSRKIDKNPSLLGCSNCIIELTDTEAFVRQGKPEDFITKKLGVSYRTDYSIKHPDVKALLKYFEQVFPEPSINFHMRKDIASMLYGRNAEKYFRMWIGDTNGSKSVYQKMIRTTFGDYYCDLPATYFSAQQKGGSGPNPELAQTDGARVAFSAEPDDDTSFKGARIKRLTGGDSFFARSCNEDGGTIETSFKNVMVLNIVPDITGMDEATKNRFCMVPFEGRWLRNGEVIVDPETKEEIPIPETHEEQVKAKIYIMDERFEDQIPKLSMALLWLAVHYYKKYREEGLTPPKYIKDWMNAYWKKNDPNMAFLTEMIENPKVRKICKTCRNTECNECDGCGCMLCKGNGCEECKHTGEIEEIDSQKSLTGGDVYRCYKRWFKDNYPQVPLPPLPRLVTILSTPDKLGKQRNRRWYGVAIRNQDDFGFG